MKYYLLNWEEKEIRCRGSETGWRDWIIRQFKEENWRSYRSEPFFLEENSDTLFSDVIENRFFWCQKMFWDVSKCMKCRPEEKKWFCLMA